MPPTARKAKPRASRLPQLLRHDAAILAERPEGCLLIGLDEVGRGSLIAGVVGGAVSLPPVLTREQKRLLRWLDDSKKLTAPVRAELSEAIRAFCHVGIGIAEIDEIERVNIHHASLLALHRAFMQLAESAGLGSDSPFHYLIMDGRATLPDFPAERQQAIVKGDGQSAAIAAASVVAKHARDTLIKALALEYPGYGWEDNMGYGTPAHLQGIRQYGITPHHRRNFKPIHQQLGLALE